MAFGVGGMQLDSSRLMDTCMQKSLVEESSTQVCVKRPVWPPLDVDDPPALSSFKSLHDGCFCYVTAGVKNRTVGH